MPDWARHKSLGARLAGDGDFEGGIAGKPGSYRDRGVRWIAVRRKSVGARLASDGDFVDAIAGKPGSYW